PRLVSLLELRPRDGAGFRVRQPLLYGVALPVLVSGRQGLRRGIRVRVRPLDACIERFSLTLGVAPVVHGLLVVGVPSFREASPGFGSRLRQPVVTHRWLAASRS